MWRRIAVVSVLMLLASVSVGSTWTVERDGTGDFSTIQPALDAAADGDTILIGPGEYTEATSVRLPGWAYNIESYAHLRCDNLTIIGAGADVTVIGPVTYQGNVETGSPAGLSYSVGGGTLHMTDIGIRHCYAMFVVGILYMDRCRLANNTIGLSWNPSGPGGWVRDSVFEATEPIFDAMSFAIGSGGLGSGIVLERCRFAKPGIVRDVEGAEIVDCDARGISLYGTTHAILRRCRSAEIDVAVSQSMGGGGVCEIYDCELSGSTCALSTSYFAPGARFVISNSRLTGGSYGVLWPRYNAGPYEVHGCDLIKGSGPVVRCDSNGPTVVHNMTDNYWGTTDEALIRSWIIDHDDDPNIGATVLYSPFAGQSVPTESTSWGDLKASFR